MRSESGRGFFSPSLFDLQGPPPPAIPNSISSSAPALPESQPIPAGDQIAAAAAAAAAAGICGAGAQRSEGFAKRELYKRKNDATFQAVQIDHIIAFPMQALLANVSRSVRSSV